MPRTYGRCRRPADDGPKYRYPHSSAIVADHIEEGLPAERLCAPPVPDRESQLYFIATQGRTTSFGLSGRGRSAAGGRHKTNARVNPHAHPTVYRAPRVARTPVHRAGRRRTSLRVERGRRGRIHGSGPGRAPPHLGDTPHTLGRMKTKAAGGTVAAGARRSAGSPECSLRPRRRRRADLPGRPQSRRHRPWSTRRRAALKADAADAESPSTCMPLRHQCRIDQQSSASPAGSYWPPMWPRPPRSTRRVDRPRRHLAADDDPDVGFDNWRKAFDSLDVACPVRSRTPPAAIAPWPVDRKRSPDSGRPSTDSSVGFCLDTCHAWAGGMSLPEAADCARNHRAHRPRSRQRLPRRFRLGKDRQRELRRGHLHDRGPAGA